MVSQIYPTELQLNKANSFGTEAPFLDLDSSIMNYIVSFKIMYTLCNLFVLREYVLMLVGLTIEINC